MNPQEIEKLLGGYATDTLTEEERRTLFEAALGNQALFDALADEQALRELLDDAPSRAHLLAELREERKSPWARLMAWMRQPSALALAAAVAAGVVTIAVVIPGKRAPKQATVAMQAPQQEAVPALDSAAPRELEKAAPEPKPMAAAPAGSPRRALDVRRQEPERDALMEQTRRQAENVAVRPPVAQTAAAEPPASRGAAAPPAASPAPVPPPAPIVVTPAQPQFRPTMETQQAQSKVADANKVTAAAPAPTGAGVRGAAPEEARKKEVAATGARDLYYAAQPGAVGGFISQPKAAKAKQGRFNNGMALGRGAATPAAVSVGGVRYTILRRNADGSFVETAPGSTFAAGDELRVRIETNVAGNLAVMERQQGGQWTLRLAARTQPGQAVDMPSESTINVTAAGTLRFFVRFSGGPRSEARLDQTQTTPGLLRETASNSVFVVNPTASAEPVVNFELTINAR